jgi:hypothetical protein
MRAGVHDEVTRARGCDHVSLSKWHRHRRTHESSQEAMERLERGTSREVHRRVGEDASDRGDPHVSRCADSKRSRPSPELFSRAKSRREAQGRRQGRQRWSGERDGAREEHSRSPASSSHRSAHGVVKRRPHRSPRNCRGVAKRHGGRTRDSVATRYDGCPLLNPWMSRSRPHASSIIGTSLPGEPRKRLRTRGPKGSSQGPGARSVI